MPAEQNPPGSQGIAGHYDACDRLLADNARCSSSNAFSALCEARGVSQRFTRPCRPDANGKAEQFIQTLKRHWAYRRAYGISVYRAASLRPW